MKEVIKIIGATLVDDIKESHYVVYDSRSKKVEDIKKENIGILKNEKWIFDCISKGRPAHPRHDWGSCPINRILVPILHNRSRLRPPGDIAYILFDSVFRRDLHRIR